MNSRSNLATLACIFMLTLTFLIQGCGSSTVRLTVSNGEANTRMHLQMWMVPQMPMA